jgi:hypothetical protein
LPDRRATGPLGTAVVQLARLASAERVIAAGRNPEGLAQVPTADDVAVLAEQPLPGQLASLGGPWTWSRTRCGALGKSRPGMRQTGRTLPERRCRSRRLDDPRTASPDNLRTTEREKRDMSPTGQPTPPLRVAIIAAAPARAARPLRLPSGSTASPPSAIAPPTRSWTWPTCSRGPSAGGQGHNRAAARADGEKPAQWTRRGSRLIAAQARIRCTTATRSTPPSSQLHPRATEATPQTQNDKPVATRQVNPKHTLLLTVCPISNT